MFVIERAMTCLVAAAVDCFSLSSCDGELDVFCRKVMVLVARRGGIDVVWTRTCLIDSASATAAFISLSRLLWELVIGVLLLVIIWGVPSLDGDQGVTALVMRRGVIDIARLIPCSFWFTVLDVSFLPRGDWNC